MHTLLCCLRTTSQGASLCQSEAVDAHEKAWGRWSTSWLDWVSVSLQNKDQPISNIGCQTCRADTTTDFVLSISVLYSSASLRACAGAGMKALLCCLCLCRHSGCMTDAGAPKSSSAPSRVLPWSRAWRCRSSSWCLGRWPPMPGLIRTWSLLTRVPCCPSASVSHTPPTSTVSQIRVCSNTLPAIPVLLCGLLGSNSVTEQQHTL